MTTLKHKGVTLTLREDAGTWTAEGEDVSVTEPTKDLVALKKKVDKLLCRSMAYSSLTTSSFSGRVQAQVRRNLPEAGGSVRQTFDEETQVLLDNLADIAWWLKGFLHREGDEGSMGFGQEHVKALSEARNAVKERYEAAKAKKEVRP